MVKYGTEINDTFCYCDCCGRRTYRENMYWNESCDGLICSDCYEIETRDCERCGENYYTCDVVYNHFANQYLCPHCNEYAMRQQTVRKGLDY